MKKLVLLFSLLPLFASSQVNFKHIDCDTTQKILLIHNPNFDSNPIFYAILGYEVKRTSLSALDLKQKPIAFSGTYYLDNRKIPISENETVLKAILVTDTVAEFISVNVTLKVPIRKDIDSTVYVVQFKIEP